MKIEKEAREREGYREKQRGRKHAIGGKVRGKRGKGLNKQLKGEKA